MKLHAIQTGSVRIKTAQVEGRAYFLAGDTSYDERLMVAGRIDGVSADDDVATATLDAIKCLTHTRPTVYLPTHDPQSAIRLASRRLVEYPEARGTS